MDIYQRSEKSVREICQKKEVFFPIRVNLKMQGSDKE